MQELLQLLFFGSLLIWPALLVGSLIIFRRDSCRQSLALTTGAATACFGQVTAFLSQFFPAGDSAANAFSPVYYIGAALIGLGYLIFGTAFIAYAVLRVKHEPPKK